MYISDSIELPELLRRVGASEHVHVRMALTRADDDWLDVRSLVVDVFPDAWLKNPDSIFWDWQPAAFLHEYPKAFLFAGFVPSGDVRRWFAHPEDCELEKFETSLGYALRVLHFRMSALHPTVTTQLVPRFRPFGFVTLPWPHTFCRCQPRTDGFVRNSDAKPLTALGQEYFRSFTAARAKLIHGVTDQSHIYDCQDAIVVRVVHPEAWLSQVVVSKPKRRVTAKVAGLRPFGTTRVALAGDDIDEARTVPPSKFVTFDLSVPLPAHLTITLVGDTDELDEAYYAETPSPAFPRSPHVIVEEDDKLAADEQPPIGSETVDEQVRPKVFISYSHDSQEHKKRVLELANRLCREGIDCHIDQYEIAPPEGWPQWMEKQIAWADYVVVVCTETYERRFSGREEPGKGLGAAWEGAIITQQLYDNAGNNDKFIPVHFSPGDAQHIPEPLRPTTRYHVETEDGYESLYRHLTHQPPVVKPPLGTIRRLPPHGS